MEWYKKGIELVLCDDCLKWVLQTKNDNLHKEIGKNIDKPIDFTEANQITPQSFATNDERWTIEIFEADTLALIYNCGDGEKESVLINIEDGDLEVLIELLIRAKEINAKAWKEK
jgi:hypothetical protein